MAVQMGVQGATHPMHESRRRHRLGLHRHERPGRRTADRHRPALHIVKGGVDGMGMGGEHLAGDVGRAQGVEHAHRLWCTEAEVERRHRDAVMGATEARPVWGSSPRSKAPRASPSTSPCSPNAAAPDPSQRPGSLDPGAAVARHLEVIGVAALAHLGHPQHTPSGAPRLGAVPTSRPGSP